MRAAYIQDLIIQDQYSLTGDILHHLVNVARIDKAEELLLLNGNGLSITTIVTEMTKKSLTLKKVSEKKSDSKFHMDLVLGIPKKDALELSLKEAVELGFRKVYLVRGSYSQNKIPEKERISSLLISALEQSNSPFLPEVLETSWEALPWNDYGTVLLLDSQTGKASASRAISERNLLIVGPEGGFSPEELESLRGRKNLESILLPTPIMRTPTAVAAGAGVLLQRLMT